MEAVNVRIPAVGISGKHIWVDGRGRNRGAEEVGCDDEFAWAGKMRRVDGKSQASTVTQALTSRG